MIPNFSLLCIYQDTFLCVEEDCFVGGGREVKWERDLIYLNLKGDGTQYIGTKGKVLDIPRSSTKNIN